MGPLDVWCPTCRAKPGVGCTSVHRGKPCRKPHRQRETQVRLVGTPRRPLPKMSAKRRRQQIRWAQVRGWVLDRDGHRCRIQVDGCEIVATEAHHLLPQSAGGPDEMGNLVSTCRPCHRHVHANPSWSYANGWLRRRHARRVA